MLFFWVWIIINLLASSRFREHSSTINYCPGTFSFSHSIFSTIFFTHISRKTVFKDNQNLVKKFFTIFISLHKIWIEKFGLLVPSFKWALVKRLKYSIRVNNTMYVKNEVSGVGCMLKDRLPSQTKRKLKIARKLFQGDDWKLPRTTSSLSHRIWGALRTLNLLDESSTSLSERGQNAKVQEHSSCARVHPHQNK